MKKTYLIPVMDVVAIRNCQVLAGSGPDVTVNSSDDAEVSADKVESRFFGFDDDDE